MRDQKAVDAAGAQALWVQAQMGSWMSEVQPYCVRSACRSAGTDHQAVCRGVGQRVLVCYSLLASGQACKLSDLQTCMLVSRLPTGHLGHAQWVHSRSHWPILPNWQQTR